MSLQEGFVPNEFSTAQQEHDSEVKELGSGGSRVDA